MTKKGFTLAETLITLAIIGVMAAILIPVLVKVMPDNNMAMLKKANTSLRDAISTLINDETNYPGTELGDVIKEDGVTTTTSDIFRGFNYNTTTGTVPGTAFPATTPSAPNKFFYLLSDALNTVGPITYSKAGEAGLGTFKTADGIDWMVYSPVDDFPLDLRPENAYKTFITVDVSGLGKGSECSDSTAVNVAQFAPPFTSTAIASCTETKIPDTYQFGIRFDGKIDVSVNQTKAFEILADPTKIIK